MTEYPWIPREYYPAVMGACKMIREKRCFNNAVSYYARRYNVDRQNLERLVRVRQLAEYKKEIANK